MLPQEIKALLVYYGVKNKDIANKLGVSHVAVTRVIKGQSVSSRIRTALAQSIGKKVDDIWPQDAA